MKKAQDLSKRLQKLEQEVKALRSLIRQQRSRSIQDLPERLEVLVGTVESEWVSIPLSLVVEVIPRVLLTPVPEAPVYVSGYMQWRGTQVPVMDLAARWGGPPMQPKLEDRIVVTSYNEHIWAFLLSHVERLDSISSTAVEPIPAEIPAAGYALGFWSYGQNSVLLLSIENLVES